MIMPIGQPIAEPGEQDLNALREYIDKTWATLTRTHEDYFFGAMDDSKQPPRDGKRLLYISQKEDMGRVEAEVETARQQVIQNIAEGRETRITLDQVPEIEIRRLPPKGTPVPDGEHGLLYLPHPYVVPGMRFNEMYNWDSAFVVRGLLDGGHVDLAKDIVDNMLYQIEHYGTVLNGNRTYYMDTVSGENRSQPPLVSAKVLRVFNAYDQLTRSGRTTERGTHETDLEWLKRAAATTEKYHQFWMTPPHYHEATGLSMYNSTRKTPGVEVLYSEFGHYSKAFDKLKELHAKQQEKGDAPLDYQDKRDRYYLDQYLVTNALGEPAGLSENFYRGDWAMRESGFDPSRRFGFFNVDIINYVPVCLNSLRYKMEVELGEMYDILAAREPGSGWEQKAENWKMHAARTGQAIQTHLWDPGAAVDEATGEPRPPGFRDLNINDELCAKYDLPRFRNYPYVTAFYPMWVGLATPEQAELTVKYTLPKLQTPHGLMTSAKRSGSQWDEPMLWAPPQIIGVEALANYGHTREAVDVANGYVGVLARDVQTPVVNKDGQTVYVMHEKHEGYHGTANTEAFVDNGYKINDVGFAWGMSVGAELMRLIPRLREKLAGMDASPGQAVLPASLTHAAMLRRPAAAAMGC